jgi:hypothetical protein
MIMMNFAATACKGILIHNWKPYGRKTPIAYFKVLSQISTEQNEETH